MRALTKIVTTLALVGAVAVIHADSDPPVTGSGSGSGSSATATNKTVVLSPAEMEAGAKKFEEQLQGDMRTVLHLKEAVRKAKDVIKLNCVNDRLVQINAQRNIADTQNADLQIALGKGALEAQALYGALQGSAEGVRRLREEASACVGEPEMFKQESGVEVTHPDIPDDPIGDNPFVDPPDVSVEPPGYASPYY